jgi:hypothetical protein
MKTVNMKDIGSVGFEIGHYPKNNRLWLKAILIDEETAKANTPLRRYEIDSLVLSVNLVASPLFYENEIFVDENKHPGTIAMLVNAGLASYTDNVGFSGRCVYPSVVINMEAIQDYLVPIIDEEEDVNDYDEDYDD